MIKKMVSFNTEEEATELIEILDFLGFKYSVGEGLGKIFIMAEEAGANA